MFGFHLFKIGVHLLLFYSEDISILIIEKINKTKSKTGRYENKNVFGFHLVKIGVHILFL